MEHSLRTQTKELEHKCYDGAVWHCVEQEIPVTKQWSVVMRQGAL